MRNPIGPTLPIGKDAASGMPAKSNRPPNACPERSPSARPEPAEGIRGDRRVTKEALINQGQW
jgi:hypothetical protein